MIRNFRHRGLEQFYLTGSKAGIRPDHAGRLRLVLGWVSGACGPNDMNLPGLRLHQLRGHLRGRWSASISGNWRVTFAFVDKDVVDVDYEDYH